VNEILLYILGVLVLVLGLALSIGLHEFGHLIPAKIFGVRVPQWAIGFGPKLFAKKIGETEYSIRLIPLGGFITMIGMFPPAKAGKPDSNRRFGRIIAASREAHSEHMVRGDENRTLHSKPAWQRIIIMLGGPTVNLLLGLIMSSTALSGIGVWTQGTRVEAVIACQEQMADSKVSCTADSVKTPAALADLRAGDVVLSVDGKSVKLAEEFISAVTSKPFISHAVVIKRDGAEQMLNIFPAEGKIGTEVRAYIGLRMEFFRNQLSLGDSVGYGFEAAGQTFGFIGQFPQQVYSAVYATVTGQARATDSAISVVGIGQVAGQVASSGGDTLDKVFSTLMLLGSLNLALFAFNMIPIPPLDGGHIAGGVYEYLKRGAYRLLGKKDPGPVDTALMAPISQIMFMVLLLAGLLMIIADFVNPITL
jgi:membrane-associated protease RseP (regulator of RpoE activity)